MAYEGVTPRFQIASVLSAIKVCKFLMTNKVSITFLLLRILMLITLYWAVF